MKPASIPNEKVVSPNALASHTAGLAPAMTSHSKICGWILNAPDLFPEWRWDINFGLGDYRNFPDTTGNREYVESDGAMVRYHSCNSACCKDDTRCAMGTVMVESSGVVIPVTVKWMSRRLSCREKSLD